jgi:hypothetical protein
MFKKKKKSIDDLEQQECLNCAHEFKGFYCPNCGQSISEFNRPFGFVFYDFLGNFLAFDSRFIHTFRDLLFKPGFLTIEFFKGRRARYAPPFRLYIFVSFVLFLLLQILSGRGLDIAYSHTNGIAQSDTLDAGSQIEMQLGPDVQLGGEISDSLSAKGYNFELNSLFKAGNIRESMRILSFQLDEQAEQAEDPKDGQRLINFANMLRAPDLLISRILKYLSYAFFILLPVFALLLKLFYLRRKVYYIRHLVFSVHIHSFMFFVLSLVVAFILVVPGKTGFISMWLLLLVPVYIYWAQKTFYKQGYLKTAMKFLLVGFVYNTILLIAFVYVFINALGVL